MDKILLFNYNIQNNLPIIIIYRQMKWRWKGTYIEAGEFGGGHEQIIIINRARGTYKWETEPAGLGLCAPWYRAMGSGAGGGGGVGGGGVVDVVPVLVVVASWWWWWWWWWRRGGGVGGGAVVVVVLVLVVVPSWWWWW